jgi:hypothetical protein
MNERIKELITQAGGYWNYGDFNMPSSVEFQEQDIAKFAELIVRECIDTVSDCSIEYCTRPQIVSEIKEHFGVEE